MQIFSIIFRTIFFYFFITASYRIMGKREIGQLGIIDLIVSILIAELVAISIENINDSIFNTILPIVALVLIEVVFGFISIKSRKFRNIFSEKPSIIITNGKINFKEMVKQRYTLDDLLLELRQKNIKNIEDVEYAVLEPNGKLSIFKYNFFKTKTNFPLPVIIDGKIQKKTLKYIDKTESFIRYNLKKNHLTLDNIFYGFYKTNKLYIIKRSDLL